MASSSTNSNLAPAHTLIARHPRTSMTHASLSSPTETHAAAAGIFPRPLLPPHQTHASSPGWNEDVTGFGGTASNGGGRNRSLSLSDLEEAMEFAPGLAGDADSDENNAEPIETDSTFKCDAQWPGTVKITVEATTFWLDGLRPLVRGLMIFAGRIKRSWSLHLHSLRPYSRDGTCYFRSSTS